MTYKLATRSSDLALAQARFVADQLRQSGIGIELVQVATKGDESTEALHEIGGSGVFVSDVRAAILNGSADLAVHSLKDLPTAPAPGLDLAAVPVRADARDAVCTRGGVPLAELPAGATIATGSPRRAAAIRTLRPDLRTVPVRGNVGTRLAKLDSGEFDAVILAAAGLHRLGLSERIAEILEPDVMLPAPAQGALAVEVGARVDAGLALAVAQLDHAPTHAEVDAERAVLAALRVGCAAPVGALGRAVGNELNLTAAVLDPEGADPVRVSVAGPVSEAVSLGHRVAGELLAVGAGRYLGESVR
ncbi:MAG: hydroxymethylbilane synthase [Candidatus Nanopelagicales bacterium]|nr:hydroxymethylbilane synthase [Candidatus Nanopelagicales bacterium]